MIALLAANPVPNPTALSQGWTQLRGLLEPDAATVLTPWAIAGGLVIAFILWARGARLVRPALTLGGVCVGAALGGVLATPLASTLAGLLLGALGGGVAGYLSFRPVSAGVAGVALGLLALAGSVVYLDRGGDGIPIEARAPLSSNETDALLEARALWDNTLERLRRQSGATTPDAAPDETPDAGPNPVRLQAAGETLRDGVLTRFGALPEQSKLFVSAATAVGVLAGLLLGMICPRTVAAMGTSGLGALGLLAGGITLAVLLNTPGADDWTREPARLLAAWGLLTVAGLWVQRPRAKPAPAPAPVEAAA